MQSTSLNSTPVNPSTRLSLGSHWVVTALLTDCHNIVITWLQLHGLTGVGLSEVDCNLITIFIVETTDRSQLSQSTNSMSVTIEKKPLKGIKVHVANSL